LEKVEIKKNICTENKQTTILLELMVERTDVLLIRVCPDGQLTLILKNFKEFYFEKTLFFLKKAIFSEKIGNSSEFLKT